MNAQTLEHGAVAAGGAETGSLRSDPGAPSPPVRGPHDARSAPPYATSLKALARWAKERLRLEPLPGGELKAVFLFEGSTCKDMGTPLAFAFTFWLVPEGGGFRLRRLKCGPVPGDTGHRAMCAVQQSRRAWAVALGHAPPLAGLTLDAALAWRPALRQSGCLCQADDRQHKWRLALETLHYRLLADENTA